MTRSPALKSLVIVSFLLLSPSPGDLVTPPFLGEVPGVLTVVLWLVVYSLAFASAVFLEPPVFFSVLVFFYSTVCLFHRPG